MLIMIGHTGNDDRENECNRNSKRDIIDTFGLSDLLFIIHFHHLRKFHFFVGFIILFQAASEKNDSVNFLIKTV